MIDNHIGLKISGKDIAVISNIFFIAASNNKDKSRQCKIMPIILLLI